MEDGGWIRLCIALVAALALGACDQRMADQPKYETLEAAALFPDRQAARWPPAGSIAHDEARRTPSRPAQFSREDLRRGRERYEIYCLPCHGVLGNGDGPVVERGFPAPPSYHLVRLRGAGLEHFVEVITEGHGLMYSYASRVKPLDRWRIAAYIRALQQSQHTELARHPEFEPALQSMRAEPSGRDAADRPQEPR